MSHSNIVQLRKQHLLHLLLLCTIMSVVPFLLSSSFRSQTPIIIRHENPLVMFANAFSSSSSSRTGSKSVSSTSTARTTRILSPTVASVSASYRTRSYFHQRILSPKISTTTSIYFSSSRVSSSSSSSLMSSTMMNTRRRLHPLVWSGKSTRILSSTTTATTRSAAAVLPPRRERQIQHLYHHCPRSQQQQQQEHNQRRQCRMVHSCNNNWLRYITHQTRHRGGGSILENNISTSLSSQSPNAAAVGASALSDDDSLSSVPVVETVEKSKERNEMIQLTTDTLGPLYNEISMHYFGGIPYLNTNALLVTSSSDSATATTTVGVGTPKKLFRVLFVLGGPGAGKGTQCDLMTTNYPTVHFSVGQLLRDVLTSNKNNNNPYKDIIQETLKSGGIVPVEISLSLLYQAMEQIQDQNVVVLVDGFPRNYDNLRGWCHYTATTNNQNKNETSSTNNQENSSSLVLLQGVLYYQCPLQVLEDRIMQRSIEQPGRSDDNMISLKKRFITFEQETVPVIEILRHVAYMEKEKQHTVLTTDDDIVISENQSLLSVHDIRGDQTIHTVWTDTQNVLNQYIIDDVLTANDALLRAIETKDVVTYQKLCDPSWFVTQTSSSSTSSQTTGVSSDVPLDPKDVMQQNEYEIIHDDGGNSVQTSSSSSSPPLNEPIEICSAHVDILSGKHVAVKYERPMRVTSHNHSGGSSSSSSSTDSIIYVQEKRIWSHHGKAGWQLVHFIRTPAATSSSSSGQGPSVSAAAATTTTTTAVL